MLTGFLFIKDFCPSLATRSDVILKSVMNFPFEKSNFLKATRLAIPEAMLITPTVFGDERGYFYESFNQRAFNKVIGQNRSFVQDNHSLSTKNILRGLHYQLKQPQAKLVRVVAGKVFDVAVDLRKSSPSFGCWVGEILSAENKHQLWIPEGFAHGFLVLSDNAEFLYKTTEYHAPEHERCIAWNDPQIGIRWPCSSSPVLSAKDRSGVLLSQAELFD